LSTVSLSPVQIDARAGSAWVSFDVQPNFRILAFAFAICIATATLFALAPALRGSNAALSPSLTARGPAARTSNAGGRWSVGDLLVVGQVAMSLVLLIGAGLFVRTLRNLESADLGVDRAHVLLVWTSPGQTGRAGQAIVDLFATERRRLAE